MTLANIIVTMLVVPFDEMSWRVSAFVGCHCGGGNLYPTRQSLRLFYSSAEINKKDENFDVWILMRIFFMNFCMNYGMNFCKNFVQNFIWISLRIFVTIFVRQKPENKASMDVYSELHPFQFFFFSFHFVLLSSLSEKLFRSPDYSKSPQGRIIPSPHKARNFWVCSKLGLFRLQRFWVLASRASIP